MDDVFGKRYGEVLLVRLGDAGPQATVYNTFPLNDCPADLWGRLDAQAIATENGAAAALLNGPRYWLMSHIEKAGGTELETRTFGGIEMLRQATVDLSSMNPAPYSVNEVDRRAVFVFDAGRPVFELVDPGGRRWVMQTWSQTVDPTLTLDDLADSRRPAHAAGGLDLRDPHIGQPTDRGHLDPQGQCHAGRPGQQLLTTGLTGHDAD